jgi:hypothetical protein
MKTTKSLSFLGKPSTIFMTIAILMAAALFFWYEYRPSVARQQCSVEAIKRADNDSFIYEVIYRHCLRTHGIEYSEQ